jgi:hypothetical protein
MTITEKIAYIKGVADTLELKDSDKKDRLLLAMIDAMDEMALAISDLETGLDTLGAQVDEIDEDLGAVEEELYDLDDCDCCCGDDDCDCDCCDDDCDCDCCCDDDCVEAVCPNCGADICIEFDELEAGKPIVCPGCEMELDFELVDDEEIED